MYIYMYMYMYIHVHACAETFTVLVGLYMHSYNVHVHVHVHVYMHIPRVSQSIFKVEVDDAVAVTYFIVVYHTSGKDGRKGGTGTCIYNYGNW